MRKPIINPSKNLLFIASCAIAMLMVSCSLDDDPSDPIGNALAIELDCSLLADDVILVNDPEAPVDYIINCNGQVKGKLTIEPGVVIEFGPDAGLSFHGTSSIQAVGTADERIIMRGTESSPGWWSGLNFITTNNTGIMEYVDISYSGGLTYNNIPNSSIIVYNRGALVMKNSSIRHSEGTAYTAVSGSKISLENNTFTQNVTPLTMTYQNVDVISASNDFTGNEIDKVTITTGGGGLGEDHVWQNIGVPYLIQGTLGISKEGSITVEPGVEIEMATGSSIKVQSGGLKIVGTEESPIIIRGEKPGPGFWKDISISGANVMNEIGYAKISGAGENPGTNKGAVFLHFSAQLNIHDTEFKDLAACGIYGKLLHAQSENPNFTSSNLTFSDTACKVLFKKA